MVNFIVIFIKINGIDQSICQMVPADDPQQLALDFALANDESTQLLPPDFEDDEKEKNISWLLLSH